MAGGFNGNAAAVQDDNSLRSKGLLPAVGVGAAVYFVTGVVSLTTLGLVGVGAGVGYGVGSWLADKYYEREAAKHGGANQAHSIGGGAIINGEQIPWALQVSLQQWQAYLQARLPHGSSPDPAHVEAIFEEFAKVEPVHAHNVRAFVQAAGGAGAGGVGCHPGRTSHTVQLRQHAPTHAAAQRHP